MTGLTFCRQKLLTGRSQFRRAKLRLTPSCHDCSRRFSESIDSLTCRMPHCILLTRDDMTSCASERRATVLFSLFLFAILAYSQPAFAAKCKDDPDAYQKAAYKVRQVRIDTPVDW